MLWRFIESRPLCSQESGDVCAWGNQTCGRLGLVETKARTLPFWRVWDMGSQALYLAILATVKGVITTTATTMTVIAIIIIIIIIISISRSNQVLSCCN